MSKPTNVHKGRWDTLYRASQLVIDPGWVDWILSFPRLPNSARGDRNLAEVAGQLGKMVELPNQNQLNLGLQPIGTPCRVHDKDP